MPTKRSTTLRGSCHCGRLHVEFSTSQAPADIIPRACDCSFCRKHGAAYISDPAGTLSISETEPDAAHDHRQGSRAARFLLCRYCGVLVAVVFEHGNRIYGAANAGCLDEDPGLASPVPASPQTLQPGDKASRWLNVWVPDVALPPSLR